LIICTAFSSDVSVPRGDEGMDVFRHKGERMQKIKMPVAAIEELLQHDSGGIRL